MTHVERTITVSPGVEEVFTYFADFTNTEEWDPGTVRTTRLSGDGGVGTTYKNVSEFLGRETELTYETITYEPSKELKLRGTNKTATTVDHLTFKPSGAGTEIHYRADFEFHGVRAVRRPHLRAAGDAQARGQDRRADQADARLSAGAR